MAINYVRMFPVPLINIQVDVPQGADMDLGTHFEYPYNSQCHNQLVTHDWTAQSLHTIMDSVIALWWWCSAM